MPPPWAAAEKLGVTDPRSWGVVGWIGDLIPHFGYGVVTAPVLHQLYRSGEGGAAQPVAIRRSPASDQPPLRRIFQRTKPR